MNSKITKGLKSTLMLSLGFSVGACNVDDEPQENQGGTTMTQDLGPVPQDLDPVPQEKVECTGAEDDFTGPCCVEVYCTEANASGICPDAAEQNASDLNSDISGSGQCECGSIAGPYASPTANNEQPCCYLVGVQWCAGRPMYADGDIIRATAVNGARWFG